MNTIIEIKKDYSLELPDFLTKTDSLNPNASLQYQNINKELFVIVIEEDRKEFTRKIVENKAEEVYPPNLKGYTDIISHSIGETIKISARTEIEDLEINGLPAKNFTIEGQTQDKIPVYYSFTIIRGENNYYQIAQWTAKNQKALFEKQMSEIAHSFKQL
ncbi:hypothetical protein Fleli_1503 [Bernardetia litoralis DSM 6794]|uniref:DUF1795 domain-containing protein n=1 Tax=Bernardetia litoralis (strain ATCC 23117 / DSM 6794 / NBRC 15988 / NCIMB 1366 / Fx l1 / Sio-4) TaxID=880071 RepID=I4AIZ0_BERLS|nr:hypothetical protein [Bernardetia litoralis]AFM03925.1 hypothetical protein Fleli_1503 [Bernardetia litoralis DSM 6794]